MLLIFAATRDASYLFSYPVAVGADGYYYVLQINELLKNHHLYYPSNTPLVFWILAALTFVTKMLWWLLSSAALRLIFVFVRRFLYLCQRSREAGG